MLPKNVSIGTYPLAGHRELTLSSSLSKSATSLSTARGVSRAFGTGRSVPVALRGGGARSLPRMELFRDPIPELKRQVARELARAMSESTVADLSELLEIGAPRISELKRCKLERYSLETLIRYAHRLSRCTQLTFGPPPYHPKTRNDRKGE
jgi:predicted XRE-type DNA-binding protein